MIKSLKLKLNSAVYFITGLFVITYKVTIKPFSGGDEKIIIVERMPFVSVGNLFDDVSRKLKKEHKASFIVNIERIK